MLECNTDYKFYLYEDAIIVSKSSILPDFNNSSKVFGEISITKHSSSVASKPPAKFKRSLWCRYFEIHQVFADKANSEDPDAEDHWMLVFATVRMDGEGELLKFDNQW